MTDLIVLPLQDGGGSGFITAVADTATIDLTVSGGTLTADLIGGGGDITDGDNVGGFAEVFRDKTTSILNFRTLQSSDSSITITQNANDLDLVASVSVSGTPNTFSYFDGAGDLVTLPGWDVVPANLGSDVQLVAALNNDGGGILHNWDCDLNALQDSPNDNWSIHNFVLDLDQNSSGFDLGSNATQTLLRGNINYAPNVSSEAGNLLNLSLSGGIGDGSTAITLDSVQGISVSHAISDAVVIGNYVGANVIPNISPDLSQYFAFNDSPNVGDVDTYVAFRNIGTAGEVGTYRSLESGPTIDAITGAYYGVDMHPAFTTSLNNYEGIRWTPAFNGSVGSGAAINLSGVYSSAANAMTNITMADIGPQFQSGSSVSNYIDINIHPAFQTGSTGTDYKGVNIQPVFQSGASVTNIIGLNVNPSTTGASLTSAIGLNIDMNSVQMDSPFNERVGLNINNGRIVAGIQFQVDNNAFVDSGNLIVPQLQIASGSPVTGTDVIMNNFSGILIADDDLAAGPIGLGTSMVGFVGNFVVASGKTVDTLNCSLGGAGAISAPGDGGNVTDFTVYRAVGPINSGGTSTVTNSVQFLGADTPASIATNNWGVRIDAAHNNWFNKNVVVGGSAKTPTNDSVGVEVAGTTKAFLNSRLSTAEKNALTAVNGMQTYDTDADEFQFYQAGVWTGLGGAVNYLIPNEVTNNSWVKSWSPAGAFATAADGESSSAQFDGSNSILFEISLSTGESLVISASNALAAITAPSDASNLLLLSDAGTGIYVSKSASSSVVTVKNRMGGSRQIGILAINSRLTSVSAWA